MLFLLVGLRFLMGLFFEVIGKRQNWSLQSLLCLNAFLFPSGSEQNPFSDHVYLVAIYWLIKCLAHLREVLFFHLFIHHYHLTSRLYMFLFLEKSCICQYFCTFYVWCNGKVSSIVLLVNRPFRLNHLNCLNSFNRHWISFPQVYVIFLTQLFLSPRKVIWFLHLQCLIKSDFVSSFLEINCHFLKV